MASSSSNRSLLVEKETPFQYPCPSHALLRNFVTVNLAGVDNYSVWKTQMLCILVSHDMTGFIDGRFLCPDQPEEGRKNKNQKFTTLITKKKKGGDIGGWIRSNALVKGWILGSLSEPTLTHVVNRLDKRSEGDFTAKEVWDKLHTLYGAPLLRPPRAEMDKLHPSTQENLVTQSVISTHEGIEEDDDGVDDDDHDGEDDDNQEEEEQGNRKKAAAIDSVHQSMYEATLRQNFKDVHDIVRYSYELKVSSIITINGNTALHVAVGNTKVDKTGFLNKMLNLVENESELMVKNADGSTLLHVAAIVGNTEAARMLVEKNKELLSEKDHQGQIPLFTALSNMHTDTYLFLLEHHHTFDDMEMGTNGDMLMYNAISSRDYNSAMRLINKYPNLHRGDMLMAIAQNFPRKLGFWDTIVYNYEKKVTPMKIILAVLAIPYAIVLFLIEFILSLGPLGLFIYIMVIYYKIKSKKERSRILWLTSGIFGLIALFLIGRALIKRYTPPLVRMIRTAKLKLTLYMASSTPVLYRMLCKMSQKLACCSLSRTNTLDIAAQMHNDATKLLKSTCTYIHGSTDSASYAYYYNNAILEATRENAYEVVEMIVSFFPDAIWSTNEDGYNIIQYAVINRSEMVYNLLYQMSEHKNIYKTIEDHLGNNLLHLASRLAPPEKLSPISGAALQIQRELQWFKEVERFVSSLSIIQKNLFGETPHMLFTKEHKELVIEGEKWMKTTAESYTITAALITTIVFAAAITVPGGSNQDTGIPNFSNNAAFTIFAISDAISLFTSVTSLLMFLSILTARFAEQDFLFILPSKLIIGLATLFISTTAMIVAFGATLYLVFGKSNSWILAPIVILTCLPVASFVSLQYPLIRDLIRSTFGRNIFGKKSNKSFY